MCSRWAGLEVEEVETAAPPFTGVRLGKILSAQKHPDADRLQVCEVSIGPGTTPFRLSAAHQTPGQG